MFLSVSSYLSLSFLFFSHTCILNFFYYICYILYSDPSRIVSSETQPPTLDSSQVETEQVVGNAVDYSYEGDENLSKAKCKSEWYNNFQKIRVKGTWAIKARCLFCNKNLVGDAINGTRHLIDLSKSCLQKK